LSHAPQASSAAAGPIAIPPATPAPRRYDRSIIEGPLGAAVWKIAWPTMLTNIIGGLQGIVDHALVGHLVGYRGNAAIGVAWQIIIIVIVFITSLFTGMSVLVARFAGSGDEDKVDRTVYQAFLTAIGISLFIFAPLGYFLSPWLLDLVNAAPDVRAEALPFLRIMFLFSSPMLVFFMLGGAALIGAFFLLAPRQLLAVFGMNEPAVVEIGTQLLRVLSVSGLFITVALTYTGGLQGTGDTRSPLYISIVAQIIVPLGICFTIQQVSTLEPLHIWLAILVGHMIRCALSVVRFRQGEWRSIVVDIGRGH
jgi:Na+-driven multidrug efflux pump